MDDHVYKMVELVGSSEQSIDDAIRNAISRAGQTIRNMGWFEVAQIRGHIADNEIKHFQVVIKVGFTLEQSQ